MSQPSILETAAITPTNDSSNALRLSERRFRALVQATHQVVWTITAGKASDEAMQWWEEITGQPASNSEWGWLDALHPQDRDRVKAEWQRSVGTKSEFDTTYQIRTRDGSYRQFAVRGIPLFDDRGNFEEWVGTWTDVTEAAAAAESLRQSEERYRLLADALPHLVWLMRPDLTLEYLNPRAAEYTGMSEEDVNREGWARLIHPDDVSDMLATIAGPLERGEPHEVEYRFRHHSGEFRQVLSRAVPMHDTSGNLLRWVGSTHDVHDRWLAEQQLLALNAELKRIVIERTRAAESRTAALADSQSAFRRQSALIESVLNSIGEIVVVTDQSGKTVLMNEAARRLHGNHNLVSLDDVAQTYTLFLPDGKTPYPNSELPLVKAHRGISTDDVEVIVRNNLHPHDVHLSVAGRPLRGDADSISGGVIVARDVTSIKKKDELLRESQERFRSAFDHAAIGMALVGLDGRWLRVNSSLCKIVGYTESELLDIDFQTITHSGDLATDLENVHQLVAGQIHSYDMEKRYIHKRGHIVHVLLSVSLVRSTEAVPLYFISQIQDITQRKVVEAELKAGEERTRLMIESIQDYAIKMLDSYGNIATWNRGAERIQGYQTDEVIGRHISMFYLPEAVAAKHPWKVLEIAKIRSHHVEEAQIVRRDGSVFWANITTTALRSDDGQLLGFVEIMRDVTLRKHYEVEMERSKAAAEAANQSKSAFLANMSHEIRTPMNGILGMADLLLDTSLVPEQREFVEAIKTSSDALLTIINDILDFSKIESGKLRIDIEKFSIRRSFKDSLKSLSISAAQRGLNLTCHIRDDVPDELLGDAGRIRQILINLVSNAIKFTHRGGVTITTTAMPESSDELDLLIAVADTGIGIPKQKHSTIFAPFEQADGSTSRKYGGTGLGLSISARLAQLMDGKIWLDSEEGRGTTFYCKIRLRISDASSPNEQGKWIEAVEPDERTIIRRNPVRSLRILVAEDNLINQKVILGQLSRLGHHVDFANNGTEAVRMVGSCEFDLVLMDVQMPELNGLDATVRIRESERATGKHIPIIGVTANAMLGDREQLLAAGMDGYLSKPVRRDELSAAIDHYLDQIPRSTSDIALAHPPVSVNDSIEHADAPPRAFDTDKLLENVGQNIELAQEILEVFETQHQLTLADIADAIRTRNRDRLSRSAHHIKGALGALGAEAASNLADRLESCGRLEDVGCASELLLQLEKELHGIRAEIRHFYARCDNETTPVEAPSIPNK